MPIRIPENLPAAAILQRESIFVMSEHRAHSQDIRPLNIAILNLMPTKVETETQLLRLLSNSPLQIEVDLLKTETYASKNTAEEHLLEFYRPVSQVIGNCYDGLIVTGAPVELMDYEEVDYWEELKTVFDWADEHIYSILSICWGAQAALYHYYGIPKFKLDSKLSGVYEHRVLEKSNKITRGFDDRFFVPHSRHTSIHREEILRRPSLRILAESNEAGVYLTASEDLRRVFVTGHSEYDSGTLRYEYERDQARGLNPDIPANYFQGDDPANEPMVKWRSHANLLFSNWLNYAVYQETPFDIDRIGCRG
ncbi:MAG: homoserine O-succinyltransferase [Spirochaetales bacterium]|uniref:Homoserine O-acetyltransferase n=1 Tax=Candidatus Thalassospirochaeta sargassi TaxID=3119039 RepID=A0AAJ1MLN3_9SPIO|nr:homoserine O-succinyltransferase [Spirochaetales bacterium]